MEIRESFLEKETFQIGYELGKQLPAGSVISLVGDLGVGKTVFTKGFAKGLEVLEEISSPTFTIVNEYHGGRLPFYHFDVYRIGEEEELYDIGWEEYIFGDGICLVEWGNLFPEMLPPNTIKVCIEKDLERGFDYRRIVIQEESE